MRRTNIEVLRFIKQYLSDFGYAPSVRDISKGMNISVTTAHYHLQRLESDGYIKTSKGISRSIVLTEKAHGK